MYIVNFPSHNRSVEIEEILDHLSSGNPAIVLVNANLLFCDTCHTKKVISSHSLLTFV